jgi:flagellar FliJ protein
MQRFEFRLENILRLRKKIEEGAEREFARRRGELLLIVQEMDIQHEKLKEFLRENTLKGGVYTALELVWIDDYITRSHRTIEYLGSRKEEKQCEVSEARDILREAKKERKVIEVLKERQWQRYCEELYRTENSELDDINQKIGLNKEKLTIEDTPVEDM